ncbi:MAG TPA: dicarboxylate--CoA ligase PimA [Hyphomicrobiaceae bacterium]|nr:dicarboxylate--CoA ligase PimA [Hyphomicrobiaceae bacterium]
MAVERPWEKSYPPGVRWDSHLEISTLPALLDEAVRRFADRTAIEYRDHCISYAELGRTSDALAAALIGLGVKSDVSVALYLPNTPYHPYFFFAVLKAGGRVVHLSPLDAERELAYKLADSAARILVTTNVGQLLGVAQRLKESAVVDHLIVADDAAFAPAVVPTTPIPDAAGVLRYEALRAIGDDALPVRWPKLAVDDVALLQYTGGTTGKPKAAMLSHANLTATISIYKLWGDPQRVSEPGTDKVICVLPLFHIFALTSVLLRSLRDGNQILLRLRFDVDTTLRDIEVKRATVLLGVPTMWIALVNTPGIERRDLSSLRVVGSGGAGIPIEVAEKFHRLTGHRMGGGWGMTETSPAGTTLPRDCADRPGSCGLPLPGILMDVVALDDNRRVLRPGEVGEIRIKGPNVTRGYFNAPEQTAAAFVDGWFLTGDIGHMDSDGFFYIVDRKKDMIISGGFNVYPRAIEEAIYEHPAVAEVVVIGVPDSYRGEAAKAFIQLKANAPRFTLEDLRAFLADKLGRHELPAYLEFRDALPKTAVGKLSKKELIAEERRQVGAE